MEVSEERMEEEAEDSSGNAKTHPFSPTVKKSQENWTGAERVRC